MLRCSKLRITSEVKSHDLPFKHLITIEGHVKQADIQLFRERLSEKVHATILKGIVGGFEFSVLQRNLKELARKATEMCFRL